MMNKKLIHILFIAVVSAVIFASALSTFAVDVYVYDDTRVVATVVPYKSGGTVFVPLRSVLEAFGAEVMWLGNNRINVVYRNISVDMVIGEKKITVNQEEKELSAAPITVNNLTMVPLQFIEEYFADKVIIDPAIKTVTITLEDDGALSDLSFLTGSISKPRAGNSYFKWSMDIPRGSRISNISFNSKYVLIDNEHRGISLEIWVDTDKGKKLEDYYKEISDNLYDILGYDTVESSLNISTPIPYAEFLYNNIYYEAVYRRLYAGRGYFYNVVLTSYKDNDPRKLKSNIYYNGIMDSFGLGYNADSPDVQDLSKVKFGLARHENYIMLENGKKVYAWSIDVPPEWEIINLNDSNHFYTKIGVDKSEYVGVEISKSQKADGIRDYVSGLKAFYDENYNPDFYEFIAVKDEKLYGVDSGRIIYNIRSGSNTYTYDENYFVFGNLMYCITIKAPQEKYEKQADDYHKIIETFKITINNTEELESEIDIYNYNIEKNFLGKDDGKVQYENKAYSWRIELPGYWVKNSLMDTNTQSFSNYSTGAIIGVEAVENNDQSKGLDDTAKFRLMQYATANSVRFLGVENLRDKGTNVKLYRFRMEKEDEDMYADLKLYTLSKGNFSYCYLSAIPDVCTSEKNVKEMQEIWNSFDPSEK